MANFSSLPPEIRFLIYEEVFALPKPINHWYPLLLTCKFVHNEVGGLLKDAKLVIRIPSATGIVAGRYGVHQPDYVRRGLNMSFIPELRNYMERFSSVKVALRLTLDVPPRHCFGGDLDSYFRNRWYGESILPCFAVHLKELLGVAHHKDFIVVRESDPGCCYAMPAAIRDDPNPHPIPCSAWNYPWHYYYDAYAPMHSRGWTSPTGFHFMEVLLAFEAQRRKQEVWERIDKAWCEHTGKWMCAGTWEIETKVPS